MNFDNDIEQCLETLEKGGLILYPTDTIWGIGCDATNEEAIHKVYVLKQRVAKKSMIVLLGDERSLITYVTQPDLRVFDYIKDISKPVTVIYDGAIGVADNLINEDGSLGIRITKDPFCKTLVKRFRKPIVSTSANVSGYPPPAVFNDIDVIIKNGVDYIVQHRQDELEPTAPSAIIKWNKDGTPSILRW